MKNLIHQPKKFTLLVAIVAIAIGVLGYIRINKTPSYSFVTAGPAVIAASSGAPQNFALGFLSAGRIQNVSVKAGDTVTKGRVLASLDAGNAAGALAQAKAAYESAQANYQKIINGATGAAIDVAKAAVNTATVNLEQITKQQDVLVNNAKSIYFNSTLTAKSVGGSTLTPPSISGVYTKETEGIITIAVNQGGDTGGYFRLSGLVSGTGVVSTALPEPIADTGLSVQFPVGVAYIGTTWTIDIPNTTAPNYLANFNAYQSALQTRSQAIALAQASLDQAQASLVALATAARPEDIAAAKAQIDNAAGAVQIAESLYANTIITAPASGTIIAVSIAPGQIAVPNAPAIQLRANSGSTEASIAVPPSSITTRGVKKYVSVKTATGTEEREVVTGAADAEHVEILSGLHAGEEVAVY